MSIGIWQIVLVLLVVLVVFGAGKLPNVMGDLGKGIKSFKEGMGDAKKEEKQALEVSENVEKPKKSDKKTAA